MIRKVLFLTAIYLGFSTNIFSQELKTYFAEAQKLEEALKEEEALNKYLDVLKIKNDHYDAITRVSVLYGRVGTRLGDKEKKIDHFNKAKYYAEQALKVQPSNAESHFVMALVMGRMAMISSGKEKVAFVKEIKTYADNALKIDPAHARAWHVLGKWNFEVTNLNMVEKAAIKLLFGGIPEASIQETIKCYEKCRSFDPYYVLNYLELAKAYKKVGQSDKAVDVLKKMQSLPNRTADDASLKTEGKKLLAELQ